MSLGIECEIIKPEQEKKLWLFFCKNIKMEVNSMKVKIAECYVKKRKKYLTDLIGEKYTEWDGKKILLNAPTGMGKTTFILQKFLFYFRIRRRRILILCNRALLRTQYWNSLLGQFEDYREIEQCVTVMTYQQLE